MSRPGGEITIDPSRMDGRFEGSDYYTHNDETRAFQTEYEQAKRRQDLQLESIEKGIGTLKGAPKGDTSGRPGLARMSLRAPRRTADPPRRRPPAASQSLASRWARSCSGTTSSSTRSTPRWTA